RPRDLNLAVAVSDCEGYLPFHQVPSCDGLSTLSDEVAEQHRRRGLKIAEGRVQSRTLAGLITDYRIEPPHLLSLDVEGHELQVLATAPLSTWRPKVVVVESTVPLTGVSSHDAWEPLLLRHGYLFATFNGINRFYVRDDLRGHLPIFQVPVNVM